jgi:phenylalanyl-tRNA synthetase beta chain
MQISLSWLNDFYKTTLSPAKLTEGMTDLGLECTYDSTTGVSYTDVVLGNVIKCNSHPNADHLSVCEVDVGDDGNYQIVCGAPNVKAGLRVPVAKIGATLGNGEFKIKNTKLRGVQSQGMICSGKELQINDDHEGIMVLDSKLPLGTAIEEILPTNSDTLFELDLTPNRGDCFSHRGVAREVATLENQSITERTIKIVEGKESAKSHISVSIADKDGCFRYAARVITGVKVGPSPAWLREKLESIGQKSINNVVDAANFVLMDTGHPLHTFDLDKLSAKQINVRFARKGEKLTTLDQNERELTSDHLLICDGDTPVALAGIMGGSNSEIDEKSTNVLLESAYFKPTVVRKGAKLLDLSTEASKRFERDTDIEAVIPALDQLASLLVEVSGGSILKDVIDIYPKKKDTINIPFNVKHCNEFLGSNLTEGEMLTVFKKLNINTAGKDGRYKCTIPTYRNDLEREVDLYEEIARVIGYNNIPVTLHFSGAFDAFTPDDRSMDDDIRVKLSTSGFNEHYSNSLANEDSITHFSDKKAVQLANPLNQEMNCLRNTLMPGLMESVSYNEKRQQANFKLFEIGAVHSLSEISKTGSTEDFHLALAWYGKGPLHWREGFESDIFQARSDLEKLLHSINVPKLRMNLIEKTGLDLCIQILSKKVELGYVGILGKKLKKTYEIKGNILISEINIDQLIQVTSKNKFNFTIPNPYPSVNRDIALQVANAVSAEDLTRTIRSRGGDILKDVILFDLYTGDKLDEGQKSLAFSLTFQSSKKTLQDADVDIVMQRIADQLHKQHQAIQR